MIKIPAPGDVKGEIILFIAGFCLMFLQFFMIREMTALLRGTEVVILLVTVSYFSGFSLGYWLAGRLGLRTVKALAVVTWLAHVTIPFSFRYLSGYLIGSLPALGFLSLLFIAAFALSSFYSVLLPRLIDESGQGPDSLPRYYGVELTGAMFGVAAIFIAGKAAPWSPPVIYQAALAMLIAVLIGGRAIPAAALGLFVLYTAVFSTAERHSLAYYYSKAHGFPNPEILYSVNSPYQKVDIIRSERSRRYIFLDGAMNYGSASLSVFNVFLSQVPARLVAPRKALIIGSGSMESVNYISRFAGEVTTVELDPAMIAGSLKHFADLNQIDRIDNWRLFIKDGKQFLGKTDEVYDLIVVDVPAPLTIQVGLLHSVEFYTLAKSRLSPEGVISVSLSGRFRKRSSTPRTVASALSEAFEDLMIITPKVAGRSFAIAGRSLPFTEADLRDAAKDISPSEVKVFNRAEAENIIAGIPPISYDNVSYPVRRSLRRVFIRFFSREWL